MSSLHPKCDNSHNMVQKWQIQAYYINLMLLTPISFYMCGIEQQVSTTILWSMTMVQNICWQNCFSIWIVANEIWSEIKLRFWVSKLYYLSVCHIWPLVIILMFTVRAQWFWSSRCHLISVTHTDQIWKFWISLCIQTFQNSVPFKLIQLPICYSLAIH